MSRPACVVINPAAARHNLARVRELAPRARVVAVIKADAYGHGLERMAAALAGADAFGVACLEEALALREAGIAAPIVLLEGAFAAAELVHIRALGLDTVVHHDAQVRMLERAGGGAPVRVWIKVDTGMHRLGFQPAQVTGIAARLTAAPAVAPPLRLMTQLACAADPGSASVGRQIAAFDRAAAGLAAEHSIANSAAVVTWPQAHRDWVRPGLMLYGASPVDGRPAAALGLAPVMTVRSALIAVQQVGAGEGIGYGAAWRCPEPMPVGVVAMGYGDGYPRHAASGTPMLVNGRRAALVGKPSMDMLCVDLRACPQARIGDPVVLWGEGLPVDEVAAHAGTVAYQLLCSVRMRARYVTDDGQDPR